MWWLIDGNNVMGARADGWWNDRAAAARRLTQEIAEWCRTHDDQVAVVFDRPVPAEVAALSGGNLTVSVADRSGRDAADDVLADLAVGGDTADGGGTTVVTSDRGLRARLPPDVDVMGSGRFLSHIGVR